MKSDEFEKYWDIYRKKGFLPHRLSDEELDRLLEHYAEKGFPETSSQTRFFQFYTEKNTRNADKIARFGMMLAGVAVGVGIVQVILAIFQMAKCH